MTTLDLRGANGTLQLGHNSGGASIRGYLGVGPAGPAGNPGGAGPQGLPGPTLPADQMAALKVTFDQRAIRNLLQDLAISSDTASAGGGLVEDPADPGTFLQTAGSSVTVTVGAAGVGTAIASAITVSSAGWPTVHYANGPYVSTTSLSRGYSKNGSQVPDSAFSAAAIEFIWDGDKIGVRTCNVIPGTTAYWVFVNGVAQTPVPVPITDSAGTAGELYELLLDFGSAASRRIKVIISAGYYGGLNGLATYSLTPAGSSRRRVAVIGDSYVGGAAGVAEMDLWINRLGLATGWEVGRYGQGGTGYVNPGASPKVPYGDPARSAQVTAWNPELIIIFGSLNDDTYSASAVQSAATALYAALATALPRVPVIVIGPQRSNTAPPAGRLANRDTLAAAAAAAPNVIGFIDMIGGTAATPPWTTGTTYAVGDLVTNNSGVVYLCVVPHTASTFSPGIWVPLTWLVGTGRVGATNGSGPTDRLIASDAVHLTTEGHNYLYRRVRNALADTIRAYLAA